MTTKNNDILKDLDILSLDNLEKNTEINSEDLSSTDFFEVKKEEKTNFQIFEKNISNPETETSVEIKENISEEIKLETKIEEKNKLLE
jgi:hypothetical protein